MILFEEITEIVKVSFLTVLHLGGVEKVILFVVHWYFREAIEGKSRPKNAKFYCQFKVENRRPIPKHL